MEEFILQLLRDQGVLDGLDTATRNQLVADLTQRANDLINKQVLDAMSPETFAGFERILYDDSAAPGTDELAAAGLHSGERRVWRLCSQQRLWSTTTKKGRRGRERRQVRRCTTTWSTGSSSLAHRTCCG
jgi:hypothetical protein